MMYVAFSSSFAFFKGPWNINLACCSKLFHSPLRFLASQFIAGFCCNAAMLTYKSFHVIIQMPIWYSQLSLTPCKKKQDAIKLPRLRIIEILEMRSTFLFQKPYLPECRHRPSSLHMTSDENSFRTLC